MKKLAGYLLLTAALICSLCLTAFAAELEILPTPAALQGEYVLNPELSDEFNGSISEMWLMDYMPWWSDTALREQSGTRTRYRFLQDQQLRIYVNGENHMDAPHFQPYYLEMLSGPQSVTAADRYLAPTGQKNNWNSKFAGFMAGGKDYLNTFRGAYAPIQSHAPYFDRGATTYGYFETRLKFMPFSQGDGIAPAFWFIGMQDDIQDLGEVDVFEFLDNHTLDFTIHPKGDSRIQKVTKQFHFDTDMSLDYHTYGVLWEESGFTLYVDGQKLWKHEQSINYRMIPIFSINHHENGWVGSVDGKNLPEERYMDIDYYRVFQKQGTQDMNVPQLPSNIPGENIASGAYISLFGLTGREADQTPMQWLNDGKRDKTVLSGLNNGKNQCAELPQYLYIDWRAPADFDTIVLHAQFAASQAPTMVDVEVSSDGRSWAPVKQNIPLNWKTDSVVSESCTIRLDQPVIGNLYTRLKFTQTNLNNGRFGLCEVELGQGIQAMEPEYLPLPQMDLSNLEGRRFAQWTFENNMTSDSGISATGNPQVLTYGDSLGQQGQAVYFNGKQQNVQVRLNSQQEPNMIRSDEDLTLSMMIKPDSVNRPDHDEIILFQQTGNPGGKPWLFIYEGRPGTYIDGNNRYSSISVQAGEWTHLVFTFHRLEGQKGRVQIYVNGELGLETEINYLPDAQCGRTAILGQHKSLRKGLYKGYMDNLVLYNTVLPAQQVQALCSAQGDPQQMAQTFTVTGLQYTETLEAVNGQLPGLPDTVTVIADQIYSAEIPVRWDADILAAIDPQVPGIYTVPGTLVLGSSLNNPQNLQPELRILVRKAVVLDGLKNAVALVNAQNPLQFTGESVQAFLEKCQNVQTKETIILTGKFPNYQVNDQIPLATTQQIVDNMEQELREAVALLVRKCKVSGVNMTLGNELSMNFMVKKSDVTDLTGLSLQITKTFADGREPVVVTVPAEGWKDYNKEYYAVKFTDISAKEMTDDITAVVLRDGKPAGDVYTESVEDYALRILRGEQATAQLKTVIVDMLNYGAEAQKYFKYNENVLANAQLTDAEKALASAPIEAQNVQVKGDKYFGSNLNLGNSMTMTVYFKGITPDMHAVVSYTKHTGEKKEIPVNGADFVRYNDTVYGIRATTLVVADAQQPVTVTVYDAKNQVVASGIDSIASYVARSSTVGELGQAILKLASSAETYFTNR